MIAAIDIETYKKNQETNKYEPTLDATQYVLGGIKVQGQKKTYFYKKKQDLWNHIIKLGKAQEKRKKTLNVYAHNMNYDFHGIADFTDKNIKIHSIKPFIVKYVINKKEVISFLDTYAIIKQSLAKAGHIIGYEKGQLPQEITHTNQLKQYLQQDINIVLKIKNDN